MNEVPVPSLRPVIIAGLVMLLLWCGYRVLGNVAAMHSPPAACQLLGGHWGIWSGWSCG